MAAIDWPTTVWSLAPVPTMADGWVETVAQITGLPEDPVYGARLLWMRGVRSPKALRGFWQAADYTPASPFEFGEEMTWAVERLLLARDRAEKVAIWGDFDADGITSTAVLWDGFKQFFTGADQLTYFIPNRLRESHGLSMMRIAQLSAQGVNLIVTCDTGSTNPAEIEYAQSLGIDVIVSDHHTLPERRPSVVAIVNPRALPDEHPMASLSGVAVAYKLIEALYEKLPDVPTRALSELVDLVAIGLIADLVELKGDCRYLAQIGIAQLQTHLQADTPTRPGVAQLLKLCRRAGDRPTDISFGLGPRINAVSRIYGDASFCVELLTSTDPVRCQELAEKAELANARRKALQNDVLRQVMGQLETSDLSTMGVIVLCDPQWPVGVLGLVAGQVAQQYGRPTILLTHDVVTASAVTESLDVNQPSDVSLLARGSARSVNQIDLYDLVQSQSHLLKGFGGHPFAAGLSLPVEDLPLFRAAINQQYRQKMGTQVSAPTVKADLKVTVSDLGRALFQELKLLEPCGMGNPVPKLLIENCWFDNVWHQKLKDRMGGKVGYIKSSFQLCDESGTAENPARCPGLWWGHYKDDLPPGRWDVVAELDFNSHPKSRRYEVRLIDIRPTSAGVFDGLGARKALNGDEGWLLDRRLGKDAASVEPASVTTDLVVDDCPRQWEALRLWQYQSYQSHQPVALAYDDPDLADPVNKWTQLLGIAKYLSRTQLAVSPERLAEKLDVCDRTLSLGLNALSYAGFLVNRSAIDIRVQHDPSYASGSPKSTVDYVLGRFFAAIQEESFRRKYFYKAEVSTLQAAISAEGPVMQTANESTVKSP
ncbi:MAG: single-stranded-DNA-specific exonuclease RecJ [Cyanobacteria bacterium J06634_6]